MPVHTLRDVFRHALGVLYDAEQQVLAGLDEMETETSRTALRNRVRQHRDETRHQIQNLERCFELLGTDAPRAISGTARALREEKRAFRAETPSPDALEVFNLDVALRTEACEIAAYRNLCDMARVLDCNDVAKLLEQNLREEEEMSSFLQEQARETMVEIQGELVRVR